MFDPLVRTLAYARDEELQKQAGSRVFDEFYGSLPVALEDKLLARLDAWVSFLTDKGRADSADRVEDLRSAVSPAADDIPF